jgi:hypothetical protein
VSVRARNVTGTLYRRSHRPRCYWGAPSVAELATERAVGLGQAGCTEINHHEGLEIGPPG